MFDSLFDDSTLPRFPSPHSLQISQVQANLDNAADPSKQQETRHKYSYQRFLRETQKHTDRCIEVLRSIGLFVSLSKLLAYMATFFLTLTNHDPLEMILAADSEEVASMYKIPTAVHLLLKVVLLEAMFQCACGIYGYVRFNKGFLFFYGLAMVFLMVCQGYAVVIFNVRSTKDIFREQLLVGYRDRGVAAKAVYNLQELTKCCRSAVYDYKNVTELPKSCCPNINESEKCVSKKAYNRTCRTTRDSVVSSLEKGHLWHYITSLILGLIVLHILEAVLAFSMVWYLAKRKRRDAKKKDLDRKKSSSY